MPLENLEPRLGQLLRGSEYLELITSVERRVRRDIAAEFETEIEDKKNTQ